MTRRRALAILLFVFVVCFVRVHLEGRKVWAAREIAGLRRQKRAVDYERWATEVKLAKLRSPAELEQRWARMPLGALPPLRMVAGESGSGEPVVVSQVGP